MVQDLLPKRPQFEGEKVKIETLINKEIVILDWFTAPSTFSGQEDKDYAAISATLKGEKIVFLTGSGILLKDLKGTAPDGKKLYDHRPFRTMIMEVKGDKFTYYKFDYAYPMEESPITKEKELSEKELPEEKDGNEIPF